MVVSYNSHAFSGDITKRFKYALFVICYNMNEQEGVLIDNINEFYRNAVSSEAKKDYNTAVTLYFKALAVLADLYILRKEGKIPSSHSERFRILEEKYADIYKILDKDFLDYQNSYKLKLNKDICEVLKNDAERLFEILGINK